MNLEIICWEIFNSKENFNEAVIFLYEIINQAK